MKQLAQTGYSRHNAGAVNRRRPRAVRVDPEPSALDPALVEATATRSDAPVSLSICLIDMSRNGGRSCPHRVEAGAWRCTQHLSIRDIYAAAPCAPPRGPSSLRRERRSGASSTPQSPGWNTCPAGRSLPAPNVRRRSVCWRAALQHRIPPWELWCAPRC